MGFVSNSSTSSFCIYGARVDKKDLPEDDDVYAAAEEAGLECYRPYDNYYVGLCWADIGGDETGNQFKARVEALIENLCGKKVACATHIDAWYNG